MAALDVVIRFVGNSSSAVAAAQEVDRATGNVSKNVTKMGLALTAGITVPLALAGKAAVNELENAGKVAAQTNAVLKSTGGVANVSAGHVRDLAAAIMEKSGMDDEAIASGENLLLTFTKVRNETGKGNDIFDRAVNLSADLAVAWGIDMNQASIKLGKALQDPIAGMTALRRVGITFTDEQKAQVKAMVEVNDTLGAQKLILKEVATQVGGSAAAYGETLAGQVSRARETLMNAGASIVQVFAPAIKLGADLARGLADVLSALPGPARTAVAGFALIVAAVGPLMTIAGNLKTVWGGISTVLSAAAGAYENFVVRAIVALRSLSLAQIATGGAITLAIAGIVAAVAFLALSDGPYERAKAAAKEWANTTVLAAKTSGDEYGFLTAKQASLTAQIDQLKAKQSELSNSMKEGQVGAQGNRQALDEVSAALQNAQAKHAELAPIIADLKQKQLEAKAANEAEKAALEEVSNSTRGLTGATNDQIAAVQNLSNAVLAAQGGALGYEAAQLQVESAQKKVDDLIKNGSLPTSFEYRQAVNQLEQAKLNAASAAMKLGEDNATLANVLKDKGVPGLIAMRNTLIEQKQAHGDTTGAVQAEIDKINGLIAVMNTPVPPKHMTISVDDYQALSQISEVDRAANNAARQRTIEFWSTYAGSNVGPHFEQGGVVPGPIGAPMLAIVHGGETIIPTGQTASALAGAGDNNVNNTYNITVKVEAGASPAEVGAGIVDAIKQYERVATSSWRN